MRPHARVSMFLCCYPIEKIAKFGLAYKLCRYKLMYDDSMPQYEMMFVRKCIILIIKLTICRNDFVCHLCNEFPCWRMAKIYYFKLYFKIRFSRTYGDVQQYLWSLTAETNEIDVVIRIRIRKQTGRQIPMANEINETKIRNKILLQKFDHSIETNCVSPIKCTISSFQRFTVFRHFVAADAAAVVSSSLWLLLLLTAIFCRFSASQMMHWIRNSHSILVLLLNPNFWNSFSKCEEKQFGKDALLEIVWQEIQS